MADDMANARLRTDQAALSDGVGKLNLDGQVSKEDGSKKKLSLASQTVHADDNISVHRAVAPAMHVATTFKYSNNPDELNTGNNTDPAAPGDSHVYSRISAPNTTRLEAVLSTILHGPSLTYASGLAAFYALIVRINPRRIAIGDGYHGCLGIVHMLERLTGLQMLNLPEPSDPAGDKVWNALQPGDVIHVETPVNPTGEARDLAFYAQKARERGAYLTVDATFAPPPLQNPFIQGADAVMHSGTKYFGGHSDMLCGVVTVAPHRQSQASGNDDKDGKDAVLSIEALKSERLLLGSVMGSLEGWLGLRSIRTLELRVQRQAASATSLAAWLQSQAADPSSPVAAVVDRVAHASLQPEAADEESWLRRQMPGGFGPVFALYMKSSDVARRLPSKLALFHHATSLGGVESLVEWRRMSDATCDDKLIRVSVGVEGWEDLRDDLIQGFEALASEQKGGRLEPRLPSRL